MPWPMRSVRNERAARRVCHRRVAARKTGRGDELERSRRLALQHPHRGSNQDFRIAFAVDQEDKRLNFGGTIGLLAS